MSRPIPEGVELPNPKAIILGWAGEFKPLTDEEYFEGWLYIPAIPKAGWVFGKWDGFSQHGGIYAADRDSEVARLNRLAKFESDLEAVIAADPQAAKEEFQAILDRRKERDKDALIRELREALAWAASCQAATLETLPKATSKRERERHARICTKLAGLLRGESVDRRGFHPFDLEQTVQSAIERCENAARKTCPEAFEP